MSDKGKLPTPAEAMDAWRMALDAYEHADLAHHKARIAYAGADPDLNAADTLVIVRRFEQACDTLVEAQSAVRLAQARWESARSQRWRLHLRSKFDEEEDLTK